MRFATLALFAGIAATLPGCHRQQQAADQNMAMTNDITANADIEALPPDESSETPTNELENGDDNPDVNASLNNSD